MSCRIGSALPRLAALAAFVALPAAAAEDRPALEWTAGPGTAPIGDSLAELDLPEDFLFLDAERTQHLMELMENPVSGQEVATVAPASDEEGWFLVFEWDPVGWVDDSEKDELDADALLTSIQEGTRAANEEREERGWGTVEIVGWVEPPHYDDTTNNLTWAIEAVTDDGHRVVNRNVKLLGRRGVMTVTLVSDPGELTAASGVADGLLGGYRFKPGSTYAEFVRGEDKVAKYGLTALVVGGAGVALAKTGLLARFWKVIVVGVVGLAGAVKRFFRGARAEDSPRTTV
jgi:uncharacterized membrane-anchored protein